VEVKVEKMTAAEETRYDSRRGEGYSVGGEALLKGSNCCPPFREGIACWPIGKKGVRFLPVERGAEIPKSDPVSRHVSLGETVLFCVFLSGWNGRCDGQSV